MIRLDLRDLINTHKPINELNNNNTDNNDNNTDCGEWKIQLSIIISCISTKNFSEKRTMCSKSKAAEVYMGSDTEDVIDTVFNTPLQNFKSAQEASIERGSEFIPDSFEVLYYEFHKINIIRAESYIVSPDWIARKKATINPKNQKRQ